MANPNNRNIEVTNRSLGTVVYELPELRVRRVFNINETKSISVKELNALWQMHGGAELIKDELMVKDKAWCEEHFSPPIEYFWGAEEVKKCLLEDSVELFRESIEFAPNGVRDLIKQFSWKLPVTDLNKIHVLQEMLGFNVQAAIKIMASKTPVATPPQTGRTRLRQEG